jgi:hypothetical protein
MKEVSRKVTDIRKCTREEHLELNARLIARWAIENDDQPLIAFMKELGIHMGEE